MSPRIITYDLKDCVMNIYEIFEYTWSRHTAIFSESTTRAKIELSGLRGSCNPSLTSPCIEWREIIGIVLYKYCIRHHSVYQFPQNYLLVNK